MSWENNNPWGNKPTGPRRSGPGNSGPDLDELFKKGHKRFQEMTGGPGSNRGVFLILIVAIFFYMLSGFYRVQEDEQGVVLRFGEWVKTTQPGLNYHLPWPVESVMTPKVERINEVEIGSRTYAASGLRRVSQQAENRLPPTFMLTGDEAFVDLEFNLAWKIQDAGKFLFNVRDQESTIIAAADSAMREIISQVAFQRILSEDRRNIEIEVEQRLQEILNTYEAGVEIVRVQLARIDPPSSREFDVVDAYNDVQRARSDLETAVNKAEAYRNDIIPRARGQAAKMIEGANAYKQEVVNRATGDSARFESVLREYRVARDVTRKRLYLEAMEEIFQNVNKVVIDSADANGVMPFLPLPELQKQLNKSSN